MQYLLRENYPLKKIVVILIFVSIATCLLFQSCSKSPRRFYALIPVSEGKRIIYLSLPQENYLITLVQMKSVGFESEGFLDAPSRKGLGRIKITSPGGAVLGDAGLEQDFVVNKVSNGTVKVQIEYMAEKIDIEEHYYLKITPVGPD